MALREVIMDITDRAARLLGRATVEGPDSDDAASTGKPIQVAGKDATGITRALRTDADGKAEVNPIVGQAGVEAGAGATTAKTQRIVIAADQTAIPVSATINVPPVEVDPPADYRIRQLIDGSFDPGEKHVFDPRAGTVYEYRGIVPEGAAPGDLVADVLRYEYTTVDHLVEAAGSRRRLTGVTWPPPDPLAFVDQTGVAVSTVTTSAAATITGITASNPISVTGGEYNINGGAFTAVAGTVVNNDQVQARHTSSASGETAVNTTVTVGGVADTFTSTTRYATTANDFDGTNDYATRTGIIGIADAKTLVFSCWLRKDGGDGAIQIITSSTGDKVAMQINAANQLRLEFVNAAGTTIARHISDATFTTSATWRHVLVGVDLAATTQQLYVDGVVDVGSFNVATNDTMDLTEASYSICANLAGANKTNLCLSEFFFHNTFLDMSVTANRRKFISAAGKPVNLGANGSTPLGVQPLLYFPTGDPAANAGSGGNFTITGALTACATSPSD